YLNDWKSGWVPALVSIAAMLGLFSPNLGVLLAIGGTIPAPRMLSDVIGTDEYSYGTRLDAWSIVLKIVKVDPILGLGPANYHWYTPLFPIRGYAVQFNSHSQYIDLIAQTGALGLGCFLWFAWAVGRLCWRLRTTAPEGFARAYVYGAFGGLIGSLVAGALGDWVLPFFYNVGLNGFRSSILTWLFLGGLVVIDKLNDAQPIA
ncbi:MAG: O-antigen ligase family protein, partial [Chloroflexi bacterium]|nr:O-antigen ligase family protein [Chloroflexota bacterium]